MKPLAEIIEFYDEPLTENSKIDIGLANSLEELELLNHAKADLGRIIRTKREELGLLGISPIKMSLEQAEILRQAIKDDPRWRELYLQLIQTFANEFSQKPLEELMSAIHIPWFNGVNVFEMTSKHENGALNISGYLSHSYITLLVRKQGKPVAGKTLSISNVLETADSVLVLGYRAGHNVPNTVMTMPAGSVDYHSGKNPLFETEYAEHLEETGLTRDLIESVEIIGKISGPSFVNNPHYVSRSRTKLRYGDFMKLWSRALDKREHKYTVSLPDVADVVLHVLAENKYDPAKNDPKTGMVDQENVGGILPQCAMSLLCYLAHKEGKLWAKRAEEFLKGAYRFNFQDG